MASMVVGDLTLESLTPSVNAPLITLPIDMYLICPSTFYSHTL